MIEINGIEKRFDDINALESLTMSIPEGIIFGLIGTNGAGKSTLLRMLSGVIKPDAGEIIIDGKSVYDNAASKKNIFFVPDESWFLPGANALDMAKYYKNIYQEFDFSRFEDLLKKFGLNPKRNISNYSKGMRKQLSVIYGISAGTKYLFLDETFDGLDPVMRQAVKSLFANDLEKRGLTCVIASHNLRELEDICDKVGLIHKGGLIVSEDLNNMKLGLQKIQCVFGKNELETLARIDEACDGFKVVADERCGRIHTMVIRGERDNVNQFFSGQDMVFYEMIPLTLEEYFIAETESIGYDVRKLILGGDMNE